MSIFKTIKSNYHFIKPVESTIKSLYNHDIGMKLILLL